MRIKLLVDNPRFNEMAGVLLWIASAGVLLSLLSYSPADPSPNVAAGPGQARNWMGFPGAYGADLLLQAFGLAGFLLPVCLAKLGWNRIRQLEAEDPIRRGTGMALLTGVLCTALHMLGRPVDVALPDRWHQTVKAGGTAGKIIAESSISVLNIGGTILLLAAVAAIGAYLLTSIRVADFLGRHKEPGPERPEDASPPDSGDDDQAIPVTISSDLDSTPSRPVLGTHPDPVPARPRLPTPRKAPEASPPEPPPIIPFEGDEDGDLASMLTGLGSGPATSDETPTGVAAAEYVLPSTGLLNAPFGRAPYDEAQLHETGRQIVARYEEFGVRGVIERINPGPVVTTFEFSPAPGMKVARIVNLSEELCLALKCESILIERIPGRSTVGIEVPNREREVISLREVIETPVFEKSESMLTFALGKDINGKIHCTDLATMPHLLVAGQTGSGKSVMVNTMVMSILLRATPDDVRFILIDPKAVEMALYRDIPHLLTPVITDMKEAINALKNATREMERRLQLLARHGCRNIGQFNRHVERQKEDGPEDVASIELEKLPYIVVIVDELADLMIQYGNQVEGSIQRLAQMARAVGIHLLLATQRPSVNVITGVIKANIPARLSFLLATRVDSRTILDSNGAESLLGRGDMLFLPPGGAGRMRRLHGPLVSEGEIEAVVSHWKDLASPQYETDYLASPDGDQDEDGPDADPKFDDPMYKDAIQLVLELGKASTSTLQRRLRLGYGRAARILDAMERDGIIGPSDGSRPRDVLRRPEWLDEPSSDQADRH
ncbi:MAG: DNA translocase FtsK [Bryobacterales bacterium]|nr:DNA translocase FtsK [Bryobacterales bacterium]MDE0264242.1 DNA translocase FtsK [Bryobacterales bacterium]MDE0620350.1 DNA translocase FtsK [Bryobacterales bacterium]